MAAERLNSEVNTPDVGAHALTTFKASEHYREDMNPQAVFEHGHWWITDFSGAAWDVVDAMDYAGEDYFDFEQVSEGEDL
jgi:hypothetical protein